MNTQRTRQEHAVVIGGSIAGLLAARVLSDTFRHVTVVDRDQLPVAPAHRKGVPQSRQTHALLARGFEILEELLPGLGADLVARGALIDDLQHHVIWYNDGYQLRPAPSSLDALLASRPLLESYLRQRVSALPRVRILAATEALSLRADGDHITGVDVAGPDGTQTLPATVVVDASGRSNRGPAWLRDLGYAQPPEDVVRANLVYVSREYRRVPGAQDYVGVIHSHYPGNPIGGGTFATDGERWLVSMLGFDGDAPPAVPGEFEEFAARLAGPELHALITTAEPITEPSRFRIGPSVRRRYDRCARLPDGFLAIGDSLCCFNPAYGQGMTTAAMSAMWLRSCLTSGIGDLTRRYFTGVKPIIDVPWDITVGNDLRFPEVTGPRTLRLRMVNRYIARLHRAATTDTAVGETFLRVANFLAPPTALLSPRMLWRVWRGRKGGPTPATRAQQPALRPS